MGQGEDRILENKTIDYLMQYVHSVSVVNLIGYQRFIDYFSNLTLLSEECRFILVLPSHKKVFQTNVRVFVIYNKNTETVITASPVEIGEIPDIHLKSIPEVILCEIKK